MSVYRSIRSTQEGTESFVNLDLGVSAEVPQQREDPEPEAEPQDQRQALQEQRSHNARFDRHAAAQLKQQTLARQSQKVRIVGIYLYGDILVMRYDDFTTNL